MYRNKKNRCGRHNFICDYGWRSDSFAFCTLQSVTGEDYTYKTKRNFGNIPNAYVGVVNTFAFVDLSDCDFSSIQCKQCVKSTDTYDLYQIVKPYLSQTQTLLTWQPFKQGILTPPSTLQQVWTQNMFIPLNQTKRAGTGGGEVLPKYFFSSLVSAATHPQQGSCKQGFSIKPTYVTTKQGVNYYGIFKQFIEGSNAAWPAWRIYIDGGQYYVPTLDKTIKIGALDGYLGDYTGGSTPDKCQVTIYLQVDLTGANKHYYTSNKSVVSMSQEGYQWFKLGTVTASSIYNEQAKNFNCSLHVDQQMCSPIVLQSVSSNNASTVLKSSAYNSLALYAVKKSSNGYSKLLVAIKDA